MDKYEFNWCGKSKSIELANIPSTGTLKLDKESSKNWDDTENLYIEGDNLEVLKLLQKSYFGKVKMIYIDPPYNTGNDFVYHDDFRDNIANYKKITNQTTRANSETNGRYHTDWLNMMYPRLRLARNLLTEDGAIFISIDDNEIWNLKKICDEVFGEYNFIADFIIESNPRGSQSSKHIANVHEYLLMYGKDAKCINIQGFKKDDKNLSEYKEEDNIGKYRLLGLRQRGGEWRREQRPNMYYPIYVNPLNKKVSLGQSNQYSIEVLPKRPNGEESRWTWGKDKFEKNNDLLIGKIVRRNGDEDVWDIFRKDYLLDINGNEKTQKPKSIWNDKEINYQNGRNDIKSLFSNSEIFDFPKPMVLIEKIIRILDEKECIIMDFFSGSATTANAIMKLNANDEGRRKFIMIQLPELFENDSQAYKEGYKNICDLGIDRIKKAGEKIVSETGKKDLDIGFKVFKLDSCDNMSEEDLIYKAMLENGIELIIKDIEKLNICNNKVYNINQGELLICFTNDLNKYFLQELEKYKNKNTRVLFF